MVIEFETTAGVVFQIDTDDKTYRRWFATGERNERHGHLAWIPEVHFGEVVKMATKLPDNSVMTFSTTDVIKLRTYDPISPEQVLQ